MRLYFARHGQTDWNLQDRVQGQADIPLNDTGIRQAKSLHKQIKAQGLEFDAVYASPLSRVLTTAKIATADRYNIIIDDRLKERAVGQFEGRPCGELFNHEIDFLNLELNAGNYGVEPIRDFTERVANFLQDLAKNYPADSQILIVSSNGVMKRAHILLKKGSEPPNFSNGGIYEYELQN